MITAVLQQLRCTGWQHARRRPWRYLLSLSSIAVAVALFVSMRITQTSILATFRANLSALAGGAELFVTAAGGVRLNALDALERMPGVQAAPVIQGGAVLVEQRQSVTVLGIDPGRDAALRSYQAAEQATVDLPALLLTPDALIATQALAQRYGWKLRDRVVLAGRGPQREFVIAGLLRNDGVAAALGGNIVFMPIPAAQRLLGLEGQLTRIELKLAPPATAEAVAAQLGPDFQVASPQRGDATFDALFAQFQVMLFCITALTGLIGVFIVYNSMALAVVQRAKEIGTLRALGAQRGEVLLSILSEAAVLGLLASSAGLLLGVALARFALERAARSLNIIMDLGPPQVALPADIWWLAPLVGVFAASFGALAPARTAAAQPPVLAMKPGETEAQLQTRTPLWFALGLLLLPAGLFVVNADGADWFWRVVGVVAAFAAVGLLGPQLVKWLALPARAIGLRLLRLPGMLALDSTVKFPTRTSLTLIALGGSLSVVVSMAGLVRALEGSIRVWLDEALPFDLTLNGKEQTGSPYDTAGDFPVALRDELAEDPRALEVYGVRTRTMEVGRERIMVIAFDAERLERVRRSRGWTHEWFPPDRLMAGEIGISENLAVLRGLQVGDTLELPAADGPRAFRICAIRPDYTWFRGSVLMDRGVYAEAFDDERLSFIDIRLREGVDVEAYRAELTQHLAGRVSAFVYRADETKTFALRVIGNWFALANIQLALAVFIGGVGIANCLLISLLSQQRQIGLLRAIGAAPAHIRAMLLTEAAFLGLAGGVLGVLLGLATIQFIVKPLAVRAAGFVLPLVVPCDTVAAAVVAGLVIALLAALLPLRAARRIDVVQAIGYE